MKVKGVLLLGLCLLNEVISLQNTYGFYRNMVTIENGTPTRRMFGGKPASLRDFPAVCAIIDRSHVMRCTGSIISSKWVITAAHCISSTLKWIRYNSRYLTGGGNVANVLYLYQHPEYKVVEDDEGDGMDVVVLRNDIGLINTRQTLELDQPLQTNTIDAMRTIQPYKLGHEEIQVLGFGLIPESSFNEQLFTMKLKLVDCYHDRWSYCICGISTKEGGQGVCVGDSGGPVLYKKAQIGVTSMGPTECAYTSNPGASAMSVFTTLHQYADIVTNTIANCNGTKMTRVAGSANMLIINYTVWIVLLFTR